MVELGLQWQAVSGGLRSRSASTAHVAILGEKVKVGHHHSKLSHHYI